MSWFEKIMPSRIKTERRTRSVPEGLWIKCPACDAVLYRAELERNLYVCPKCSHHMRIGGRERLERFLDPASDRGDRGADHARRIRSSSATANATRIASPQAQKATGETDALIVLAGTLEKLPVVACAFEFQFLGGSMGSVVGERFKRGADHCIEHRKPLVCFTASGGARMQEALYSLLQMAKTAAALSRLAQAHLPFISVMTDPTTGGVSASLAMLGDLNLAEPRALIGFAGPRVIQQTVRETLPEGFQRSEFLLDHGTLDMIVDRRDMRERIASLLRMLLKQPARRSVSRRGPWPDRSPSGWRCRRQRTRSRSTSASRVSAAVARRLGIDRPRSAVITVGGTNGKGSTVAHLEALWLAAGRSVGLFTSPHFLRYNERIRINGVEADDVAIVAAFERIEAARGATTLTFFEYNTLAALQLFAEQRRRAGAARGGARRAARCHQSHRRRRVRGLLDRLRSSRLAGGDAGGDRRGKGRHLPRRASGGARHGAHAGERVLRYRAPRRQARGRGAGFQLAAGSRFGRRLALELSRPPPEPHRPAAVDARRLDPVPQRGHRARCARGTCRGRVRRRGAGGDGARCADRRRGAEPCAARGRFQVVPGPVEWILDIAHNPPAAEVLAAQLRERPCQGRTLAVVGILGDKDAPAIARALQPALDRWFLCSLEGPRGISAAELARRLEASVSEPTLADSVQAACAAARASARAGDRVVVCGSVHTVGPALEWLGVYSTG